MSCPFVTFGLLPVMVAFMVSVLLGILWFSPLLFGTVWLRLIDRRNEEISREEYRRPLFLSLIIPGFISVLALTFLLAWMRVTAVWAALAVASLVAIGFVAMALLGLVFSERRSLKLTLIHTMYLFCSLNLSALILMLW